jgi:hypothetical protein
MEVRLPSKQSHETLAELVSEVFAECHFEASLWFQDQRGRRHGRRRNCHGRRHLDVWFDHILDDLPGPSAPHFRLERIWNWCLHYERRMWARITCEDCGLGGAALLTLEEKRTVRNAFVDRLAALPAFNKTSYSDFREPQYEEAGSESDDKNINGEYMGKTGMGAS